MLALVVSVFGPTLGFSFPPEARPDLVAKFAVVVQDPVVTPVPPAAQDPAAAGGTPPPPAETAKAPADAPPKAKPTPEQIAREKLRRLEFRKKTLEDALAAAASGSVDAADAAAELAQVQAEIARVELEEKQRLEAAASQDPAAVLARASERVRAVRAELEALAAAGAPTEVVEVKAAEDAPELTPEQKKAEAKASEARRAELKASVDATKKDLAEAQDAVAEAEEKLVPKRSPAFNWDLVAGVQLSQADGRFSQLSPYVNFVASERLGSPRNDGTKDFLAFTKLYPFFNVALEALPTAKQADPGGDMDDFITDAEKTASLVIGMDYRLFEWKSGDDSPNETFFALHFEQGIHTFVEDAPDDAATMVDDVNSSYGVGFKIGEYVSSTTDRNPSLYRFVNATFGDYGQFGNRVWTIEGLLRFAERADQGFFVGVRAILGRDGDSEDFSIVFGINDVLGIIAPIFEGIGGVFESDS